MHKVRTCLWFDGQAEEAARFYVSLIEGSKFLGVYRPTPEAPPLVVEFTLAGAPYQILNGGPKFKPSEAASIVVQTKDQNETDRLWLALTEGGEEGPCGWLKDRYGISWQIVPEALPRLLCSDDPAARKRVLDAMMAMKKIEIAGLEAAASGK